MTRRALICDDDSDRAYGLASSVRLIPPVGEEFEVSVLDVEEFGHAARALYRRRAQARDASGGGRATTSQTATHGEASAVERIDEADLLILDYDLTSPFVGADGADQSPQADFLAGRTGEMIAYLARCYSRCGYIVVFNKIRRRTFDLTMQRFVDSYADLNVVARDLGQRALWVGHDPNDRWRPTQWPKLLSAPALFERRVDAVRNIGLNASVLDALGFGPDDRDRLDPRQVDALTQESDQEEGDGATDTSSTAPDSRRTGSEVDLDAITFDDLLASRRIGLGPRDRQDNLEQRVRIAAAAAGRWLDRLILPAHNVITDAPHLRYFHPSLDDLDSDHHQLGPNGEFDRVPELARSLAGPAHDWFDRWTCSVALAEQAVFDMEPTSSDDDSVLCEDTSRFVPMSEAKEFQSDVPGPYTRRFVEDLRPKVAYAPPTRLYP